MKAKLLSLILLFYIPSFGALAQSYTATWAYASGLTINADGSLTKTGTSSSWDAGAASNNTLRAGADGWMEFTVVDSLNNNFMVGLSYGKTTISYFSIEYAFQLFTDGLIRVYEKGSYKAAYGYARVGDILRIARVGNLIKYYKNGIEVRSVSTLSEKSLIIDNSIYLGSIPPIITSFSDLRAKGIISPPTTGNNDGGIAVEALGGLPPYSYQWNSGETSASISGKSNGEYYIIITDSRGSQITKDFRLGFSADWQYLPGVTLNPDNSLNKTVEDGYWNAGASAHNRLNPNTDGWLEFTVNEVTGNQYMVGFSEFKYGNSYSGLKYGLYIVGNGAVYVHESGVNKGQVGTANQGDVFRVERVGSNVHYYKNESLLRTVEVDVEKSYILNTYLNKGRVPVVTCSFSSFPVSVLVDYPSASDNGSITITPEGGTAPYTYAWSSGESTSSIQNKSAGNYSVTITDANGISVQKSYYLNNLVIWDEFLASKLEENGGVSKVVPTSKTWDAGASSANRLYPEIDGWLEFVVNDASSIYFIGLSKLAGNASYQSIEHSFYVNNSILRIYRNGVNINYIIPVKVGDVLRIAREGSQITYYQNGILVYSYEVPSSEFLIGDVSIYAGKTPPIIASFASGMKVSPTVDYISSASLGVISLQVTGGYPPYTYAWSSGESTASIDNKASGDYSVGISDSQGSIINKRFRMAGRIDWKDSVNVSTNKYRIEKTVASSKWDGVIVSKNRLGINENGWLEFKTTTKSGRTAIGFGKRQFELGYNDIAYAFYLNTSNEIFVFESGVNKGKMGVASLGDTLRIERVNGVVNYLKNGTVLYTSLTPSTQELGIDVSMYDMGAHLEDVKASFINQSTPIVKSLKALKQGNRAQIHWTNSEAPNRIVLVRAGAPIEVGPVNGLQYSANPQFGAGDVIGSDQFVIYNGSDSTCTLTGLDLNQEYFISVFEYDIINGQTVYYKIGYPEISIKGYGIQWVNKIKTEEIGEGLKKTSTGTTWDAGASSTNTLKSGQDGWLEFSPSHSNMYSMVGLSQKDLNIQTSSIEYGIYVHANRNVLVYEKGANMGTFGTYQPNDVFRIERINNVITYYKNGVALHTSTKPSATDLVVDVSIYSPTLILQNIRVSFYDPTIHLSSRLSHPISGEGGNIEVSVLGGLKPYRFTWSTGERNSAIYDKGLGTYMLTVTDTLGNDTTRTFQLGHKVMWHKVTGAIDQDSILVSSINLGRSGTSGARGLNELLPNQDGWVDIQPGRTFISGGYHVGFNETMDGFYYTAINYGFNFTYTPNTKNAKIFESGTAIDIGAVGPEDVFRVAREGNEIKYYKNDSLLRTTVVDPAKVLYIKANVYSGNMPALASSFETQVAAQVSLQGSELGLNNGYIKATALGGTPPYTYNWSSGETADSIVNKAPGDYWLAIKDTGNKVDTSYYTLGYRPVWRDLWATLEQNGRLYLSDPASTAVAGAVSINELEPNTDGWLEFRFENASDFTIGFATDTILNANSFAWSLNTVSDLGASYRWSGTSYHANGYMENGDVVRISREGNKVKYYRNGKFLIAYTCDPTQKYFLKVLLKKGNSPVINTSFSTSKVEGLVADRVEYNALKELFTSTKGESWSNRQGWPYQEWPSHVTSTEFATWYGVHVKDGDIHGLYLSGNNLNGEIPSSLHLLAQLDTLDISSNAISSIADLNGHPNQDSLRVLAQHNYLSFAEFDKLRLANFALDNIIPQNEFPAVPTQKLKVGSVLSLQAADPGLNGSLEWEKSEGPNDWMDITELNESSEITLFKTDSVLASHQGVYRWRITNTDYPNQELMSAPSTVYVLDNEAPLPNTAQVPASVKTNPQGKYKSPVVERQFYLSQLQIGTIQDLMVAPPCLEGKYYAGFQLYYDLGDKNTQIDWSAYLEIKLFKGEDTVWTESLHIDMLTQTFISTAFYQELVECFENYKFLVSVKNVTGEVPQDNVHLKILLHKHLEEAFEPSATVQLMSVLREDKVELGWTYEGPAVLEFDVEWVFIAAYEGFEGSTSEEAFAFKEPLRITTADYTYKHHVYYPDGNLWYRVRAVGYNPLYPNHRIAGNWSYFANAIPVSNPANTLNWQQQSTFAENGKYKKVMSYFDGSLRQRQVQTNLSSEGVTLVAESLYDYEGRQSVSVLAAPALGSTLEYKAGYHVFEAMHDSVEAYTSTLRKKFHYDNYRLENSTLADTQGAGQYFSPNNASESIHKELIPDAEGYAYSQTEYLNDGTGRVSRQSGVGAAFQMEGEHTVKNYYGEANTEELVRLFGTNVGNAQHYKKNLVVDANGQVSVSYLDQAGRVIATALAGDTTSQLEALPSYLAVNPSPININLNNKNTLSDQGSTMVQKILNTSPSTVYTIHYKLDALASLVEEFGCQNCTFDISLSISNPQGELLELPALEGNEDASNRSYTRTLLTASDCSVEATLASLDFQVLLPEIGDYTLVKSLKAHELSFEQMRETLLQNDSIISEIEQLWEYYPTDPNECEICIETCEGSEELINETMGEVAAVNCANIYNRIVQQLKANAADDYEPSQAEIEAHALYCQYQLCLSDSPSDIFDMKLARVPNWSTAQSSGFDNPLAIDPFFQADTLNGHAYLSQMQARLANVLVATVRYDSNGDGEINENDNSQDYQGPIAEVTDPANTTYYVGADGQHNVNGKHLLYMDLMGKRASLGEEAYQNELNILRWNLYRGFYMEAKRKTKLADIAAYNTCAPAKADLELIDNLPTNEEDIIAWGDAQGITGPISVEELEMSLRHLSFACDTTFSSSDSTAIQGHLQAYFDGGPSNFFKIILNEDLAANEDLLAIDAILENYGCSLDRISMDNPITCLRDTTITVPVNSPILKPSASLGMISTETTTASEDINSTSLTTSTTQKQAAAKEPEQYEMERDTSALYKDILEEREKRWKEWETELLEPDESEVIQKSALRSSVSTSAVSYITSEAEYNALIDLYHSTNGANWVNNTGWAEAISSPDGTFSVQGWHGVETDELGHIILIVLPSNNLSGVLSSSLNDLIYIQELNLFNNKITSIEPNFGYNWEFITILDISNNLLTEIPTNFGFNWLNIYSVKLNNNNISSIGSAFGVNWSEGENCCQLWLNEILLGNNKLTSLPNDFGINWYDLRSIDLSGNLLTSLPNNFGFDWENIRTVKLGYNLLSTIPVDFGVSWSNLSTITLIKNEISEIPERFGENWTNLDYLAIAINPIKILPDDFGVNWSRIEDIDIFNCLIESLPRDFGLNWNLRTLEIDGNLITELPDSFGSTWTSLDALYLGGNKLNSLPENFGQAWSKMKKLTLSSNPLVNLPDDFGINWIALRELNLIGCKLTQLPPNFGENWSSLTKVYLSSNNLHALPPNFGVNWINISLLNIGFNFFQFEDILPVLEVASNTDYKWQATIDVRKEVPLNFDGSATLSTNIDRNTSPASQYKWYKIVNYQPVGLTETFSENNHTINLSPQEVDMNVEYYYEIINPAAPNLKLISNRQTLVEAPAPETRTITYCLEYDTANVTLAKFQFKVDWNRQMEECLAKAAAVDSALVELATEKLIEEKIATYYNSYRTQCIDKLKENIDYTFSSKEYHYTLYHYDQAGSLVQTVPPQGVHPLSASQVEEVLAGTSSVEPAHTMRTRYQYNSLNQLTWQETPDAGQSRFWYNAKSQLRLSQNAQQALDNAYSYTKYDVLGRIIEVGELNSSEGLEVLLAQLDEASFPSLADPSNTLSDITKTHYDFPSHKVPEGFLQENLRNRVAWVEVIDKNSTDTTATFYSYDIHGNVKSLMQFIPGLAPKRTDYRYDLVSGNVNEVFYQAGQPDQFIHRYTYDADNRIRKVATSTDGFIWYDEATYYYYQHGPLARVELGEYHTQGLDYYYTLQGWLKGVNMPFQGDPGHDGLLGSGADAFAYNLGYYPGDYKAIASEVVLPKQDTESLWNHSELYNGNIAWMITDLPSLGLADQERTKGLQAMRYRYDQLNRITQSQSLQSFDEASGFAQRSAEAQAYDENYTYDANGNILTLTRHDEEGALKDDFVYSYYAGTNKLEKVKPEAGTTYIYDAIGNLIQDNEEGTQISWTPYGKVREVHKGDSLIIRYRYDAAGNRVEKKVITLSAGAEQGEAFTRYVRDASGNVMAVYKSTQALESDAATKDSLALLPPAEFHVYGSSRLGLSTTKPREGHLSLGLRKYELSNHLGNVLAVVSDKANFMPATTSGPSGPGGVPGDPNGGADPDAQPEGSPWYGQPIWATVESTSDYYPFGLEMAGRTTFLVEEIENDTTQQAPAGPEDYTITDGYYWPFEGGSLEEAHYSGLTAVNYGSTVADDQNGDPSALHMGGTAESDYVKIYDNDKLDVGAGDFAVSFKFKKYAHSIDWNNNQGVGKWSSGGDLGNNEWHLGIGSGASGSNPIVFTIEAGTTHYEAKGQSIPNLNEWYHALGQRKGDSIYVYLNGALEGKTYIGNVAINNAGRDVLIGRILSPKYSQADFDEVRIVKRALSPAEIQQLQTGPAGTTIAALAPALTEHLVARYTFDGNTNDLSDNQMHASPVNGTYLREDKEGRIHQAYAFDGVNDRIQLPEDSKQKLAFVQNTGVFTMAAYVKINNLNGRNTILASSGTTAYKGFLFMYENYGNRNHVLRFTITNGASGVEFTALGAPYAINDNDWHHVAVVGDGQHVRFYIDGVQDGAATPITLLSSGDARDVAQMGLSVIDNAIYSPLKGGLDEMTVFNKALSPAEVQSLMQSHTEAAPVAHTATPAQRYRYGFNGKEKDTDFANHYDYGFRIYNPRIAKFLSVDPLTKSYPMLTPYQFASNTPIQAIDLDGLEGLIVIKIVDMPTSFNKKLFASEIERKLIDAGAHKETKVVYEGSQEYEEIGAWGRFWNYKSNQSATITIRKVNVYNDLDRIKDGGNAVGYGEDGEVVLFTGLVPFKSIKNVMPETAAKIYSRYYPNWVWVNVALHELGHSVYDFINEREHPLTGETDLGHDDNGVHKEGGLMNNKDAWTDPNADFTDRQKDIIIDLANEEED